MVAGKGVGGGGVEISWGPGVRGASAPGRVGWVRRRTRAARGPVAALRPGAGGGRNGEAGEKRGRARDEAAGPPGNLRGARAPLLRTARGTQRGWQAGGTGGRGARRGARSEGALWRTPPAAPPPGPPRPHPAPTAPPRRFTSFS